MSAGRPSAHGRHGMRSGVLRTNPAEAAGGWMGAKLMWHVGAQSASAHSTASARGEKATGHMHTRVSGRTQGMLSLAAFL